MGKGGRRGSDKKGEGCSVRREKNGREKDGRGLRRRKTKAETGKQNKKKEARADVRRESA